MATKVEIINTALDIFSVDPIQSAADIELENIRRLDDAQRQALSIYDMVKDSLLSGHSWTWARRREAISVTGGRQADHNNLYQINKPSAQYINIRALYNGDEEVPVTEGWYIEGDFIYAPFNTGYIEYTRNVDEEAFPPLFVEALVMKLCSQFAMPMLEDVQAAQLYERKSMMALREAQRVDSQSRPAQSVRNFSYTQAHFRGRSTDYDRNVVTPDVG